jgi:hypothetical protein
MHDVIVGVEAQTHGDSCRAHSTGSFRLLVDIPNPFDNAHAGEKFVRGYKSSMAPGGAASLQKA